jgi:hypothetical protein
VFDITNGRVADFIHLVSFLLIPSDSSSRFVTVRHRDSDIKIVLKLSFTDVNFKTMKNIRVYE